MESSLRSWFNQQEANDGQVYLFISIDIDVIDPVFTPGTPKPGGLLIREARSISRRLCTESKVVGLELEELNPLVDSSKYLTANNTNGVVRESLTGLAMRKRGLTGAHAVAQALTVIPRVHHNFLHGEMLEIW